MSAKRERKRSINLAGAEFSAHVGLLLAETPRAGSRSRASRQPVFGAGGHGEPQSLAPVERTDHGFDVQYIVSRLLAEGADTEDTLLRVCGALRDAQEWDEVSFWPADEHAGALRSVLAADVSGRAVAASAAHAEQARGPRIAGIGVVGRVLALGEPVLVTEPARGGSQPKRPATASDARSVFAFPVQGASDLLGVIVCLSASPRAADTTLLRAAASLGATIGSFIERQPMEEEPRPETLRIASALEQLTPVKTAGRLRQLEAVFNAVADSVLICDRAGHILHVNVADRVMLGYDSRSTRFTTTLRERGRWLTPRDDRGRPIAEERSPFARILHGETLTGRDAVNATVRTADGRDIQVSVCGAPILDTKGNVKGGVIVTQDVTEHRRHERALRDANRRMEEALALAAHDLRTPITASRGYVQLAAKGLTKLAAVATAETPTLVESIEQLRRNLEDADHSTQRLARLVDRLLDVARIQANRLEMRPEVVDLAAIVATKVQEQRLATPAREIRYTRRSAHAVPALADPDRIGQVLLNYLANALKFSLEDSAVQVTLAVSHGEVRVSVRDAGPGIPAAEQQRIWLRFEQLDNARRHGAPTGLGLGLYISRAIVEGLGGHVGVNSALGRGSTFWFALPLAQRTD